MHCFQTADSNLVQLSDYPLLLIDLCGVVFFFFYLFALVVSKVLYIFQRLASRHYLNILRIIFDLMYI